MVIYFYKVWEPYGCFSNFSPHSINIQGISWDTVEHYYQAQKYVSSPSQQIIKSIHSAASPEEAAALGRDCNLTLRHDWDIVKTKVMREAVLRKFMTHLDIREILLGTDNSLIVENSAVDYFWGCGADKSGQNHLGNIIMSVREEIRNLQQNLSQVSE
jgi:hypothetical protein